MYSIESSSSVTYKFWLSTVRHSENYQVTLPSILKVLSWVGPFGDPMPYLYAILKGMVSVKGRMEISSSFSPEWIS